VNPWNLSPAGYSGIGSRKTPSPILATMIRIAEELSNLGWILRTGGAQGADSAFEAGAQKNRIERFVTRALTEELTDAEEEAYRIASTHHPAWNQMHSIDRRIHLRNVFQVLGRDLNSPSSFVLCWTPDGSVGETTKTTGGTGMAIRIAFARSIPIYNLAVQTHIDLWNGFLTRKPEKDDEYLRRVFS
jgi:hypothetical protein